MNDTIKETAERIVKLDMEVEAPGHIAVNESALVKSRDVLQQWIAGMKGIVVNPSMGRVTIIDQNGKASTIASPDLCFMLSAAGITQVSVGD